MKMIWDKKWTNCSYYKHGNGCRYINSFVSLTKNKTFEFCLSYVNYNTMICEINTYMNKNTDHAGFYFEIGIFGFSVEFSISDNRHWNYGDNKWED